MSRLPLVLVTALLNVKRNVKRVRLYMSYIDHVKLTRPYAFAAGSAVVA